MSASGTHVLEMLPKMKSLNRNVRLSRIIAM